MALRSQTRSRVGTNGHRRNDWNTLPEGVMPTVMSGAVSGGISGRELRACVVMAEALLECRVGCLLNHVYRYGTPSSALNHAFVPYFG